MPMRWLQRGARLTIRRKFVIEIPAAAKLRAVKEDDIMALRSEVIGHAYATLDFSNASISWSFVDDRHIQIDVAASEDAPSLDRVSIATLERAKRLIGTTIETFGKAISRSVSELSGAHPGQVGPSHSVYYSIGLGEYTYGGPYDFFASLTPRVLSEGVKFDVDSQIASSCRDPVQLRALVTTTVHDAYARTPWKEVPNTKFVEMELLDAHTVSLTAEVPDVVESVVEAVLEVATSAVPTRRAIDRWPPASTPYWGTGNLILAIVVVAIAAFPITAIWLGVTAIIAALVLTSVLVFARRAGADLAKVALGMAPATIILGCAVYYGACMIIAPPSVVVTATPNPHLVDAFLLSVGMASTGGFFDLALRATAPRVVALAEMLLMVSVAGSSLYVGARALWGRMSEIGQGVNQG